MSNKYQQYSASKWTFGSAGAYDNSYGPAHQQGGCLVSLVMATLVAVTILGTGLLLLKLALPLFGYYLTW